MNTHGIERERDAAWAFVTAWRLRRTILRRQARIEPHNKRLLYARADELKQCYEALASLLS